MTRGLHRTTDSTLLVSILQKCDYDISHVSHRIVTSLFQFYKSAIMTEQSSMYKAVRQVSILQKCDYDLTLPPCLRGLRKFQFYKSAIMTD